MKKPPLEAVFLQAKNEQAGQVLKPVEGFSEAAADDAFLSASRTVKGHAGRCGPVGSGLPANTPCAWGPARLATRMPA
jgi:hypothetical protein